MAFSMVVVGTSLGGLSALEVLLGGLPKNFAASVAVVQHRHKSSSDRLSAILQQYCSLPLGEAEDKEVIMPGRVYLAPSDYHLLVESVGQNTTQTYFALSTDAPVCYSRPSIDVLFESAADAYAERVIGVILTGANHDGAQGLVKIKMQGGVAVVEEPATAFCRTMPEAAIAALKRISPLELAGEKKGKVSSVSPDSILPLSDIAPLLVNLLTVSC